MRAGPPAAAAPISPFPSRRRPTRCLSDWSSDVCSSDLEDENLLEQVRRVGGYFSQKLRELVEKFDIAVESRGMGAIQALQLTVPGKPILEGALAKGLLINVTQDTVLRFLPPVLQ